LLTFSELKELESEAIDRIRTLGVFGKLSSLQEAAKMAQIVKAKASTAPINFHMSFTLPTRLREDPGHKAVVRPFHVGCLATAHKDEITQLTYSVLIGETPGTTRVARKFHFDFEPADRRNQAEPKPTFHLQMCGELSAGHQIAGYGEADIAHLLPAWSQPRIPALPMSFALVLNWLLVEFGHDATVSSARRDPCWQSTVRTAERAVLKPYYKDCFEFLDVAANKNRSFYTQHLYSEN
jgi:hypothetical protein